MALAAGTRITWRDLPAHVRAGVEAVLEDVVVSYGSQPGGFSPGTADRVVTASGRRAFVKAVSAAQNARTPDIHRAEAAIAARLPASEHVPRLLGLFDDGEWVALVLQDVDGRHPVTPWEAGELSMVLSSLRELTSSLTPSPIGEVPRAEELLAKDFAGWVRVAAKSPDDLDGWVAARLDELVAAAGSGLRSLRGESLVHTDLRADNVMIRHDATVVFVDWPWACLGPAWLDPLLLLVDVNACGGHDMEALVKEHLEFVPEEAVTGVLAGLAGYFTDISRQPPPPGLPTVRAFQRRGAETTLAWLKQRMA